MELSTTKCVDEYVKQIITIKHQCHPLCVNITEKVRDCTSPQFFTQDTTLKNVGAIERLYIPFHKANTEHKLKGRIRMCYKYAFSAATYNTDLVYCEGMAISRNVPIPLPHAWCVHILTGEVYDPTWKNKHQGTGYCGIPFNRAFILNAACRSGEYGILDSLWRYKELLEIKLQDVVHSAYLDVITNKT